MVAVAKRVVRKALKKTIEMKRIFANQADTSVTSASPLFIDFSPTPAEGLGIEQRIGNKIRLYRSMLNVQLQGTSTPSTAVTIAQPAFLRIIVFWAQKVVVEGDLPTTVNGFVDYGNMSTNAKVLYDRVHLMYPRGPDTTTVAGNTEGVVTHGIGHSRKYFRLNFKFRGGRKIEFDDGAVHDKGFLQMYCVSDAAATFGASIKISFVSYYTDG